MAVYGREFGIRVSQESDQSYSRETYDNKCCFAAYACDRPGPEKLVIYEKSVTNAPRVILL